MIRPLIGQPADAYTPEATGLDNGNPHDGLSAVGMRYGDIQYLIIFSGLGRRRRNALGAVGHPLSYLRTRGARIDTTALYPGFRD